MPELHPRLRRARVRLIRPQAHFPPLDQLPQRLRRRLQPPHRLRKTQQARREPQLLAVDQLDEAELLQPAQRLGDLVARIALRHALVRALLLGRERAQQGIRAHRGRQLIEQLLARDDAALLQPARLQVGERQALAHDHLRHAELALAERLVGGQQKEVAVAAVDQLVAVAPVELLQQRLRVEQERVPALVALVDVAPAPQREVDRRKALIRHHVADLAERFAHGSLLSLWVCPSCQSSITRPSRTGTHGRCRARAGGACCAASSATLPALAYWLSAGRSSVAFAVSSDSSQLPIASARSASSSCTRTLSGSTGAVAGASSSCGLR